MNIITKMVTETLSQNSFKFFLKRSLCSDIVYDYKEAVSALNSLQTNAHALQVAKNRIQANRSQRVNVEQTIKYLSRVGVTVQQLEDKLSVIHVSGTKGKGSTSAYCEAILRCHGYKTGFFSSPHLVAVRERIRINGLPLSEADFTRHFWNVYKKLEAKRENDTDMPAYFKFLTVMAFNVFLQEKVDVAVIEVGVGGEYDCTNILTKVPVVGITSLGLDHTSVLGKTIQEIALQKGGIMKPGCFAFIAYNQPVESLMILQHMASHRNSSINIAPLVDEYTYKGGKIELAMNGEVHKINAGLALQLAKTWMDLKTKDIVSTGQQCKTRWRNIRDHYRKVKKQERNSTTGSAAIKKRASYWERLRFLDTVDDERETISNAKEMQEDMQEETVEEDPGTPVPEEEEDNLLERSRPEKITKTPNDTSIKKKRNFENVGGSSTTQTNETINKMGRQNKELLDILKKRSKERTTYQKYLEEALRSDTEDEIDLFFKTLAATVKKFDPEMKAEVKSQIFSIVTKYEMQHIRRSSAAEKFSTRGYENRTPSTPASFASTVPSYDSGHSNDSGQIQVSHANNNEDSGNYFQVQPDGTCYNMWISLHYFK